MKDHREKELEVNQQMNEKSGSAVWSATGRKPIVRSGSGKSADRCIQPGTDRCIWPATDESADVWSAGLWPATDESAVWPAAG